MLFGVTKMKYIHLEFTGIILFSKNQNHKDMAARFPDEKVLSAGHVKSFDGTTVKCFGESMTLGISADDLDTMVVNRMLELGDGGPNQDDKPDPNALASQPSHDDGVLLDDGGSEGEW